MFNKELQRIDVSIRSFLNLDIDKEIEHIHKDNMFNKGHSFILSSFDEIKTLSLRLDKNINLLVEQERKIQRMPEWRNHVSGRYPDVVQVEMKKSDHLGKEVRVDFKALYLFSKILLDKYVKFLFFINPVDGVKSGTVEKFLNSLSDTKDLFYKELYKALGQNSKDISNKLTFYRDKKIEHEQILNEDICFMNEMNGGISISHIDRKNGDQTTTIQPVELLKIIGTFFETTSGFLEENKKKVVKWK